MARRRSRVSARHARCAAKNYTQRSKRKTVIVEIRRGRSTKRIPRITIYEGVDE